MSYERNNNTSSNHYITFDTGESLPNFDCHSIALNHPETNLLLVGNHDLAFINFETIASQMNNMFNDDTNTFVPSLSDFKLLPLFDKCNVNRPVVEWSHFDSNQYAVAIDRFVRIYAVDHGRIVETNAILDSQHQRPISTISYSPHDPARLLTGSFDGQIHIWDMRNSPSKAPAVNLKLTVSLPFSIRRIQWSPTKSDNINQLAVQCDRCVRIYDMRRLDAHPIPAIDIEQTHRIISMDWTMQNHAIATISTDQSMKIFSTNGHVLAESLPHEHSPFAFSKIRTTMFDNLFVCATRDTNSPTYGFVGWRWDEDQYLRPLTDRIVSTTPSPIVDFCFIQRSRTPSFTNQFSSSRVNNESNKHFFLLTWCRDGRLYLVDMDSTFRQALFNNYSRSTTTSVSDSTSSNDVSRTGFHMSRPQQQQQQQQTSRRSSAMAPMDPIKDEATDGGETDDDDSHDNAFEGITESSFHDTDSPETNDENDISITSDPDNDKDVEVTIENELNCLNETYGPYVIVESKDEQRRMCIIRCIYSPDHSLSFRIYLILSRHYPIISQLFVRFKLSAIVNDEHLRLLQSDIQSMLDETSQNCFYHGNLCLHKCLLKLKPLIDFYHKKERFYLNRSNTMNLLNKKREQSSTNSELESINSLANGHTNNSSTTNNNTSTRVFGASSSSTRTSDSQLSNGSFSQINRRTCGARFAGGTHLICFGRVANNQSATPAPVLTPLTDGSINRTQPLPMRSISLIANRESLSTDEPSAYRPPTTNTMPIQLVPNNQRTIISSAPIRSLGTSVVNDSQRIPTPYRRSMGQLTLPHSTVSIYDVSILLPVSKKLADEYKIDLNNPMEMCEVNQEKTEKMAKDDLIHCWRLLDGLLSIQPNLRNDDPWFQTPIAQGLIKHLVSTYVLNGDIQSASMFLLTMSQTPYLKNHIQSKLVTDHEYDPVLYAYASLLHRWKYFYKRTQILSQIDHNCQPAAPTIQTIPQTINTIICSICLKPVLGQHFLCANCGHGGHLTHMHEWFSFEESKHKICPEKDCSCRCLSKQQELLNNTIQIQQQTSTSSSRSYFIRQTSGNIRSLQ